MKTNYYLLGTTYYVPKKIDMYKEMVCRGVVSIAWGWSKEIGDMSRLYGKKRSDVIDDLKSKGAAEESYIPIARFLQLKPDDIVALKTSKYGHGNPSSITVRAYAEVKEKNGIIYHWDNIFYHMINAKYGENKDLNLSFQYHYPQTIYHITDPERIRHIFSPVLR